MPYLIAVVVVVGVLCVLNVLLTYGVIRRLREHSELLGQRPLGASGAIIGAGSTIGSFTATTVAGDPLVENDLASGTLVAFFSPDCRSCLETLPRFVDAAAAHPGGRDWVLAVVIGSAAESAEQVAALLPNARVVVVQHGHEIMSAFGVRGLPGFALIGPDRVVTMSGGLEVAMAAVKATA